MKKFCTKCGNQIEEGEICSCQQATANVHSGNEQFQNGQPYRPVQDQQSYQSQYQQYQTQPQFQQPSQFEIYFKRVFNLVINIIKKPATVSDMFVRSEDKSVAWGIVGLNALVFAIMMFSFYAKIMMLMEKGLGALGMLLGSGLGAFSGMLDSSELGSKLFFGCLIGNFVVCMALAGIILFFTKVIYKKNITFNTAICVMGAGLIPSIVCMLIAALAVHIYIPLAIFIYMVGTVGTYFFTYSALKPIFANASDELALNSTYIFGVSNLANIVIINILVKNFLF